MRFEATAGEIRALLRLAELDAEAGGEGAPSHSLASRRAAAAKRVPAELLGRYEALLKRGRAPAVSAARRGYCSSCHLRLPAQLEHQIQKAADLFTCPFCRRMLYGPHHLLDGQAAEDPPAGSGPGVAAPALKG